MIRKILICLILFTSIIHSQEFDINKLNGIKPRAVGPAGMSGRITAIDVVNSNPSVIYIGAASGGVWKSESEGIDWVPIFDQENLQAIGAITIQQSNPDVIWVGTGEGNPRNSLNGGFGIYKSIDGGINWKLMGLEKTRNIHRIIIDKNDPNIIYVAAIGSPWGEHPERGVFKSIDGGKSWKKILFINDKTGAADLVVDPSNPNKLIAAMWEHRRKPYTFQSGGEGSGLYISYDGGEHWKRKNEKDGLPKGHLGRIGLAISQSNPKVVYALIESSKNALYKSEDGGFTWKMINNKSSARGKKGIGNRPFYYSDIFVDPQNENRIYTVFTYVNFSIDGGKSFDQLMPAYNTNVGIHPDHHAWWIHPENPNFMIDGNDGGLNITKDQGKTWRFVENLPIGQFYHINVDNEFPYNLYGGMQDNGSWVGPAYVLKSQGIRNSYWQELMFGDGFDVIPDPDNTRYGYAMSQQGYVGRYDLATGLSKTIRPTHPNTDIKLRFNWNAAIALDPFDHHTIYFGSQFVHKSMTKGNEWDIISPDLTTNDSKKQKQHDSGGLTMDATGAENYCTILAISPSTLEKGFIWVGTDDGKIQITKDRGASWTDVTPKNKNFPKDGWVAQIRPSNFENGTAYIIVNNYRNFDFKPYLFRTKNYGKSWESMLDDKPESFGYTLSFVQDPIEQKLLFLGTENGLYMSVDEGNNWTKWTKNYPSVPTMDMVIHPREHDLDIATFGRSFYVIDDIRPLREIAKKGIYVLNEEIKIFDPPTAFITSTQQPNGTRFGGNAIFNGENRKRHAMISYVINQSKDIDLNDVEKKKDSLTLNIYNSQNKLIRNIHHFPSEEDGLQRMYWDLKENGVRRPKRIFKKDDQVPSGVTVIPGEYKLVIQFDDQKDSTLIHVKFDPRNNLTTEVLSQKYGLLKEIEAKIQLTYRSFNQLNQSRAIVIQYRNQALKIDKKIHRDLIRKSDTIVHEIDALIDLILGKEDKRQGITASENPSNISYLYTANSYIQALQTPIGKTELKLIDNANLKIDPVIQRINQFYQSNWLTYRKLIEEKQLSLFKDYDELK